MVAVLILHGVPVHVRHDRAPVEAIALDGPHVLAAGSLAEVTAVAHGTATARGETAVLHRLDGGALMPAFSDPHQHAYLVAADPQTDVLVGLPDLDHLLATLRSLVRAAPDDGTGWLRFHGHDPLSLAEHRSPTAAELDRVVPDRPLHAITRTYHESSVNSAGLAALGITDSTPDPPGGRIVRDRRGRATGVLLESASFLAEARSRPALSAGTLAERLAAHGRRLVSEGITRIGDAAVPASLAGEVVGALAAVGVRTVPLLVGHRIDEPAFVAGGTAKVLVDGGEYCHLCLTPRQLARVVATSLRASTGPDRAVAKALARRGGTPRREPDGLWHTGIRVGEPRLHDLLRDAADHGSRIAAHAIGNGAVDAVLAALLADRELAGAVPLRLEHAMTLDPQGARRLALAGVPVVAQPSFLTVFGHDLNIAPVPEPLLLMPFRTLLDAGVDLAFSSDHPAVPLSPFAGIAAAVTRRDGRGRPVHPQEAICVAEALTAYTMRASRLLGSASGASGPFGVLEPGADADLVWADADPHRVDVDDVAGITVLATWSGGRLVHRADAVAASLPHLS